jgi:hypothetical protein
MILSTDWRLVPPEYAALIIANNDRVATLGSRPARISYLTENTDGLGRSTK